jgi:putative transposase
VKRNMEIRKGRGYVYGLQYHLVWCVKYRKKILSGEVDKRLKEILKEQAISHEFMIIELETDLDHIHMLFECSPQHYIPNIAKALKREFSTFSF